MPINVFCSECKKTYRVKDQLAGKRGKCPQGHVVVVPQANVETPQQEAVRTDPSVGPTSAPAVKEEVPARGKTCGSCGAALPDKAVLCVQCGLDLRTGKRIATTTPAKRGPRPILLYAGIGGGAVVVIALAFVLLRGGKSAVPKSPPASAESKPDAGTDVAQANVEQKAEQEKEAARQAEEARVKHEQEKEALRQAEAARLKDEQVAAEKKKEEDRMKAEPPWRKDFEAFIPKYQDLAFRNENGARQLFDKQAIEWTLPFRGFGKFGNETTVEFDGIIRNLGGTGGFKGPVAWFHPAPNSLPKWKSIAKGTRVTFTGKLDLTFMGKVQSGGDAAPTGAKVIDVEVLAALAVSHDDLLPTTPPALDRKQSDAISTAVKAVVFDNRKQHIDIARQRGDLLRDLTLSLPIYFNLSPDTPSAVWGQPLKLDDAKVKSLLLGKGIHHTVDLQKQKFQSTADVKLDFEGLGLVFPDRFSISGTKFPARTVIWYKDGAWQTDRGADAFEKVLAKIIKDIEAEYRSDKGISPARAPGEFGPAARAAVPALILALAGNPHVAANAAESLKQITNEDFGKDKTKWQVWWKQKANVQPGIKTEAGKKGAKALSLALANKTVAPVNPVKQVPEIKYSKTASASVKQASWIVEIDAVEKGKPVTYTVSQGDKKLAVIGLTDDSGIIAGKDGNWQSAVSLFLSFSGAKGKGTMRFALLDLDDFNRQENVRSARRITDWLEIPIWLGEK